MKTKKAGVILILMTPRIVYSIPVTLIENEMEQFDLCFHRMFTLILTCPSMRFRTDRLRRAEENFARITKAKYQRAYAEASTNGHLQKSPRILDQDHSYTFRLRTHSDLISPNSDLNHLPKTRLIQMSKRCFTQSYFKQSENLQQDILYHIGRSRHTTSKGDLPDVPFSRPSLYI